MEVSGTTEVGNTLSPKRLLIKVDFPLLNWPSTTRWKRFPPSFSPISRRFSSTLVSPRLLEIAANFPMQPMSFWLTCLYWSSIILSLEKYLQGRIFVGPKSKNPPDMSGGVGLVPTPTPSGF